MWMHMKKQSPLNMFILARLAASDVTKVIN